MLLLCSVATALALVTGLTRAAIRAIQLWRPTARKVRRFLLPRNQLAIHNDTKTSTPLPSDLYSPPPLRILISSSPLLPPLLLLTLTTTLGLSTGWYLDLNTVPQCKNGNNANFEPVCGDLPPHLQGDDSSTPSKAEKCAAHLDCGGCVAGGCGWCISQRACRPDEPWNCQVVTGPARSSRVHAVAIPDSSSQDLSQT